MNTKLLSIAILLIGYVEQLKAQYYLDFQNYAEFDIHYQRVGTIAPN